MLKLFKKIISLGHLTESGPTPETADTLDKQQNLSLNPTVEEMGSACHRLIKKHFAGSLAIRMVDAGSCNACELEMHALNNVFYNIERFGIHFVASPRHADVLLVTGIVSKNMEAALKITYEAMPEPKRVIAMGNCACYGGECADSYACLGKVSRTIPVHALVPGCPPTPLEILKTILQILQK